MLVYSSMVVWQYGSMVVWQYESMAVCSMAVWVCHVCTVLQYVLRLNLPMSGLCDEYVCVCVCVCECPVV